jgi:serine/threonine protein kinase
MPNGSLFNALRRQGDDALPADSLTRIAVGMARGLEYMRAMHRDFKSQNVLLDSDLNAVICDYGITRVIGKRMTCELVTIQWAAPELMQTDGRGYGCSIDTYAFGITLWELIARTLPYRDRSSRRLCRRPDIPDSWPPALNGLLQGCWARCGGYWSPAACASTKRSRSTPGGPQGTRAGEDLKVLQTLQYHFSLEDQNLYRTRPSTSSSTSCSARTSRNGSTAPSR